MARVELIFDKGCPNVQEARARLQQALKQIGAPPEWQEWDRADPASPEYARAYGSPTILVEGKDVAGARPTGEANCCRVYRDSSRRLAGVPGVDQIVAALRSAGRGGVVPEKRAAGGCISSLAVVPVVAAGLLPSIACPACWPVYAALLSSLGIGFVPTSPYLLAITLGAVTFALAVFAWQARRRRRLGPLVLAAAGAVAVLVGRFTFHTEGLWYAGVAMLVGASLWDVFPGKRQRQPGHAAEHGNRPACPLIAPGKESG